MTSPSFFLSSTHHNSNNLPPFKSQDTRSRRNRFHWADIKVCREFFDAFAAEQGLDPLDATRWYSFNLEDMLQKEVKTKP